MTAYLATLPQRRIRNAAVAIANPVAGDRVRMTNIAQMVDVLRASLRRGEIELPAVEASVARTADGKTVVALVNLDPDRPARVSANLKGSVQRRLLTAPADGGGHGCTQHLRPPRGRRARGLCSRARDRRAALELPPKSIVVVTAAP